jgi:hypothetical protein
MLIMLCAQQRASWRLLNESAVDQGPLAAATDCCACPASAELPWLSALLLLLLLLAELNIQSHESRAFKTPAIPTPGPGTTPLALLLLLLICCTACVSLVLGVQFRQAAPASVKQQTHHSKLSLSQGSMVAPAHQRRMRLLSCTASATIDVRNVFCCGFTTR